MKCPLLVVKRTSRNLPSRRPLTQSGRAPIHECLEFILSGISHSNVAEILHCVSNAATIVHVILPNECSTTKAHHNSRFCSKCFGHGLRVGNQFLVRHDPADKAETIRFFGAEAPTGKQQLESTMATNDARKVSEMYRGNNASINLWVSKSCALTCHDAMHSYCP